jgi:uncharacterized protein (DUF2141 family)
LNMVSKDSLEFELRFPAFDSTGSPLTTIDTILLLKKNEDSQKGLRRRNRGKESDTDAGKDKKKVKRIALRSNIKNVHAYDLNRNVEIFSSTPAFAIKSEKVKMYKIEDTTKIPVNFKLAHDADSKHGFIIGYKFEERSNYRILIPDSTITDIYGTTNDTTIFNFTTQAEDYYGTLSLNISNIKGPVVLQLLDEKENLINEKSLQKDTTIAYDYLHPRKYIVKMVIDSNGNGKWDTGDYLKKIQPEQVIYYPQIINVRSNWAIENSWQLSY